MVTSGSPNGNGHKRIWWAVATILTAMALLLVIVGWSWKRADAAVDAATDAEKAVIKVQTALPYIEEGIRDIKREQAVQSSLLIDLVKDKYK